MFTRDFIIQQLLASQRGQLLSGNASCVSINERPFVIPVGPCLLFKTMHADAAI